MLQPPDVMDFTTDREQERLDPQPVCDDDRVANSLNNGAWTCLEFLLTLIHASERGDELLQLVLRMLEMPMSAAPDVVLLGFGMLASVEADNIRRKLPSHVISNLAPKLITSASPTSRKVLAKLSEKAFPAYAYAMHAAYAADGKSIQMILELAQVCCAAPELEQLKAMRHHIMHSHMLLLHQSHAAVWKARYLHHACCGCCVLVTAQVCLCVLTDVHSCGDHMFAHVRNRYKTI
jgi:hypothetical protein